MAAVQVTDFPIENVNFPRHLREDLEGLIELGSEHKDVTLGVIEPRVDGCE